MSGWMIKKRGSGLSYSKGKVPTRRVDLPADDGFLRDCGVQWWYWTGHLTTRPQADEDPRTFGYEVVFFAFRKWGILHAILSHHTVSDPLWGFRYDAHTRLFKLPKTQPGSFHLESGPDRSIVAQGGGGTDHLLSDLGTYRLDLHLHESKPPVAHYDGTAHPYIFGGYTYYYSRERMATSGTLWSHADNKEWQVEGVTWFDRQYGELLPAIHQGWQWFWIHFDNHEELMVFWFLHPYHSVESFASYTNAHGMTQTLGPDELVVSELDSWLSPHTGVRYPSKWLLRLLNQGRELLVEPILADQELRAERVLWSGPEYWEGACVVKELTGHRIPSPQPSVEAWSAELRVVGKAYVELNGYSSGTFGTLDTV